MYYGTIKKCDIANGPGVRTSLFVSGCRNHCEGCFNRETWAFDYGEPFDSAAEEKIFSSLDNSYTVGLTVLGGEPMEPENQRALLPFLREVRRRFPDKSVWLYTGNLYEELIGELGNSEKHLDITRELLSYVDFLVDGRFVFAKKNIGLRFRGSENQRIIDLRKTEAAGHVVIWEGCSGDRLYGKNSSGKQENKTQDRLENRK